MPGALAPGRKTTRTSRTAAREAGSHTPPISAAIKQATSTATPAPAYQAATERAASAVARWYSRASLGSQYVADAADSLNERGRKTTINFPAQVRDVHVDDIIERRCAADLAPNVLG
jgi:hypothetical protein